MVGIFDSLVRIEQIEVHASVDKIPIDGEKAREWIQTLIKTGVAFALFGLAASYGIQQLLHL